MLASTDKVKRGEIFDLVFMRQYCIVMLSEVCGHGGRADSRSGRPGESVLHASKPVSHQHRSRCGEATAGQNARAECVGVLSEGRGTEWGLSV